MSGGKGGGEAASFIFQHLERFKQQKKKKKKEPWRRCRKADKRSVGVHRDKHRKHTQSLPRGLLPQRPHSTVNVIIFHSLVKYGRFGCAAPVRPYWLLGLICNNSGWGASRRIPELPVHCRGSGMGCSQAHYGRRGFGLVWWVLTPVTFPSLGRNRGMGGCLISSPLLEFHRIIWYKGTQHLCIIQQQRLSLHFGLNLNQFFVSL